MLYTDIAKSAPGAVAVPDLGTAEAEMRVKCCRRPRFGDGGSGNAGKMLSPSRIWGRRKRKCGENAVAVPDLGTAEALLLRSVPSGKENGVSAGLSNQIQERVVGVENNIIERSWIIMCGTHSGG